MSEIRLPAHLTDAVRHMTADPLKSEHSLFEDAYKGLGRLAHKAVQEAEEHPVITTAAILVGAALALYSTRGESIIAGKLGANTEKTAVDKLAAQLAERSAVLKDVGPIPDVVRPMLDGALGANAVPEQFVKAAGDYSAALNSLKKLPLEYVAAGDQKLSSLAQEILEQRTAISGERITAEVLSEEEKRLTLLNPQLAGEGGTLKIGSTIKIYNEQDLTKLAEKTQFKFVPQLGQFLKENGVTEEQIGRALEIQKAQPVDQKKLLGQILTDEGLATKEQVDAAFGKQGELKKVLAGVRKEVGF
jgi:hypothetical protein